MVKVGTDANSLLGLRVRARRILLGLSQEEVGLMAGIHWTNLGRIERGQANPSFTTLLRIAGALSIAPSDLLDGIDIDDLPA